MEFIYFKIFLTKIIFFVLINLTLEQKEINNISTPSPPPFNTLNSLQLISKNLSQCHILLEKIPEELKEYNKQLEYALKLANNISSEVGEVLLINEEKELPGQLQDHHREWTINGDIEIENEPEILKGNNDGIKILKNNFFELNKTELLTLENIDKYLERQLRQAKNKHCLLSLVNKLAKIQKSTVNFRIEATGLNKEIKELLNNSSTNYLELAKAEIKLTNSDNKDVSSSMNIYGIITGGDKQKIFYGISATNFQNRAKSNNPPTSGYNLFSGILNFFSDIG